MRSTNGFVARSGLLFIIVNLLFAISVLADTAHRPVGYHGDYDVELFPGGTYLVGIPTPEEVL